MWTYAVALSHRKSEEIKVRIVYTDFNDPKEAIVRAVSQEMYEHSTDPDGVGMTGWTHDDLRTFSLNELLMYYKYSGRGMTVSVPVKVPGQ